MSHDSSSGRVRCPVDAGRIVVIGVTGSGKTMLSRQLSQRLGIAHVELDALNWGPNWAPAPVDVFRQDVAEALSGDAWVVDGNYREVRSIAWARATTIVWLDYPLWLVMTRLVWRTLRRIFTKEELWNGNRERFWDQFFSRESIFLYAISSFKRRRKEFPLLFKRPEYSHLSVVRLRSPRAARRWLFRECPIKLAK